MIRSSQMSGSRRSELLVILLVIFDAAQGNRRHETSSCIETWNDVLEGELSSPNFPSKYNPNDLCVWNIQVADQNSRVVLTFEAFMLEDSLECANDFVEIGEPQNTRMKHGQRLCGMKTNFKVVSQTNHMTVLFQSDGENQFPGFRASFKVVPASMIDNSTTETQASPPYTTSSTSSNGEMNQYDVCRCGEGSSKTRRIVGGQVVKENKFPWLVVFVTPLHETSAHCGGVLVTPKHIITAAHCTRGRTAESYRVVGGAYDLFARDSGSYSIRNVARLIPHESYNRTSEENDIAVVELTKDFDLGQAIQTICLPPKDLGDLVGETTVTAGWGKVEYMGESSALPRAVDIPVVTNEECSQVFKDTDATITDNMLCAGVLDGTLDACQGDSGGPLMWFNKRAQRWQLAGVVSFGVRCATPGFYGVYTRVSKYLSWIENQIGGALCNVSRV